MSDQAQTISPAAIDVAIDGFPSRSLGLGARLIVDLAVPGGLPLPRSPGPTVQVHVGPQLRVLDSAASGRRAGWFRLEPRFAVAITQFSPMAGSAKYGPNTGYLDAGTLELRHIGGALRIEGAFEIAPQAVVVVGGRFAGYPPLPGSAAGVATEPSAVTLQLSDGSTRTEEVEVAAELLSSAQLAAGGRLGLLFADPHDAVSVGPTLSVDLVHVATEYPNAADGIWCAAECSAGDEHLRRVYSTRRDAFTVRAGVDVRFGAGGD